LVIDIVAENKGLFIEDEYEKYDPEGPNADYKMEMQGFHIIESRINLPIGVV
jgi:hypothetical protein